jgi:hypothetical protein
MTTLLLIYAGPNPGRISSWLDAHHVRGWTELSGAHGAGSTGRREGTRAWPGESTVVMTVVPEDVLPALADALKREQAALPAGERLHVAALKTDFFF